MKLTLAIAALTILIVALLLTALRYFQKTRTKGAAPLLEPTFVPTSNNLNPISPIVAPFDAIYWAQMNDWHVKE